MVDRGDATAVADRGRDHDAAPEVKPPLGSRWLLEIAYQSAARRRLDLAQIGGDEQAAAIGLPHDPRQLGVDRNLIEDEAAHLIAGIDADRLMIGGIATGDIVADVGIAIEEAIGGLQAKIKGVRLDRLRRRGDTDLDPDVAQIFVDLKELAEVFPGVVTSTTLTVPISSPCSLK